MQDNIMKSYLIEEFASNQGSTIYRRNTETGFYTSSGNEPKGLMDFLCLSNYSIRTITRQEGTKVTITAGLTKFSNGERVIKIKIIKNKVILYDRFDAPFSLDSFKPFSEPKKESSSPSTTATKSNKFAELQARIEQSYPREIRLESTLRVRKESLQEFITLFFTKWNKEKRTIYVDNKEVQTETNKRRSLGDLFMICKYYYPSCTLEDVLRVLYIQLPVTHTTISSFCSVVKKRVWRVESTGASRNINDKDEYGNNPEYYINLLNK